jgi:FHS family L-fucose permease-like MFS transporter
MDVQGNEELPGMSQRVARTVKELVVALTVTGAAMLLWGFSHRLYATLMPGLGAGFSLTPAQSDMARSAIAIGYFLMTLPTAFISRNLGYKAGVLFGLGTFAVGMFLVYPAVERQSFLFFVISATVVGSGLAILEVTAPPLVVFLGRRETAVQRTVMAESLSPIGALAALYLGPKILASAAATPGNLVLLLSTIGVAAIVLAFVMEMVPFPSFSVASVAPDDRTLVSFRPLLRIKRFRYAVAATSLCLFAQIVIAAIAPLYSRTMMPSLSPAAAQQVLVWAYLALAVGRFAGPLMMTWIAPLRLLVLFAVAAMLCSVLSALTSGPVSIACLIGTCFFMSIVFPTIFADIVLELGDMAKTGTAILMFVAFTGTGFFALLTVICRPANLTWIMLLPALCYTGVAVLAVVLKRTGSPARAGGPDR